MLVAVCLSFFPERLHCCYIDFHCSYLYSYYNSSRTLCIKCWDSAFRTEIKHFIPRFNKISLLDCDTTKRRVRGWKEAQRKGEFADISLMCNLHKELYIQVLMIFFLPHLQSCFHIIMPPRKMAQMLWFCGISRSRFQFFGIGRSKFQFRRISRSRFWFVGIGG